MEKVKYYVSLEVSNDENIGLEEIVGGSGEYESIEEVKKDIRKYKNEIRKYKNLVSIVIMEMLVSENGFIEDGYEIESFDIEEIENI